MNDLFKSMTYKELTEPIENYGEDHPTYWGCALAGEAVGEALEVFLKMLMEIGKICNLIKKHERDGINIKSQLGKELADIFIYLELTAQQFNINLELEIRNKLSELKVRKQKNEMAKELYGSTELFCDSCNEEIEAKNTTIDGDGWYDETGKGFCDSWLVCPKCELNTLRARKEVESTE